MRPEWDAIWMSVSKTIAQRSIDPRYQVGAIIVSDAEQNALIKLDYNNPKKKKMYVSLSPCSHCAKMIVNANIDEVVYADEYRDTTGIDIMRSCGITVRRFDNEEK